MSQQLASIFWGRLISQHESHLDPDQWQAIQAELQSQPAIIQGTCQRCGNQDLIYFDGLDTQGQPLSVSYCHQCIQLGRMSSQSKLYGLPPAKDPLGLAGKSYLTWQGSLSAEQGRAKEELLESLKDRGRPHMVHAVTGAGKTEMIFPLIDQVVSQGGRVAIVSPRVDVCLELYPRIQAAFSNLDLVVLHGAMTEPYRYTPILIATTHQMLRFKAAFDLMIVDEVDAFPYAGDPILHQAVQGALGLQGKLIYLTATPDKYLKKQVQHGQMTATILPARYHGYPLPEPDFHYIGPWEEEVKSGKKQGKLFQKLSSFLRHPGKKLIFMANIALAEQLYSLLTQMYPDLACVHAQDPERQDKVMALREGNVSALITTSILERGVTFENCHVYIVGADNRLFTSAALIQMSGRVGRKSNFPRGTLIYGHNGVSMAMWSARQQIKRMNRLARERGLLHE